MRVLENETTGQGGSSAPRGRLQDAKTCRSVPPDINAKVALGAIRSIPCADKRRGLGLDGKGLEFLACVLGVLHTLACPQRSQRDLLGLAYGPDER